MSEATRQVEERREVLERRDRYGAWTRRVAVTLLTAVVVLALFNIFGQRADTTTVDGPAASISLRAPSTVRPGLLFQVRIAVTAHQNLPAAQLVLGPGWFDGLTLNTGEPGPPTETSGPGGSVIFGIGRLRPGETYVQYLEYQVNPTSLSRRDQTVALRSRDLQLLSLDHRLTIIP